MKTIQDRKDVHFLVSSFYEKIRNDDLLGSIFNKQIPDDSWGEHIEKLTDFWETTLFNIPSFKGNPRQAHINVDKDNNYQIEQLHFGRWLNIWFEVIDTHFEGLLARKAKDKARNMATGQYLAIWKSRPRDEG